MEPNNMPLNGAAEVISERQSEEILQKFDTESRFRNRLTPVCDRIWKVIAIVMSLFHLYIAGFGTMPVTQQRILHLMFAMTLVFLLYPARKKSPRGCFSIFDTICAATAVAVNLYLYINVDAIALRNGKIEKIEVILGIMMILLLLEATRRCLGNGLMIIAVCFIAYAFCGPYLPGMLHHKGYTLQRIVSQLYISSEGIYGTSLGVSSTYIFLFILFGAFLGTTGLSQLFNSFSISVAGRSPGGPAKVSIFASGLLGMINGSAPANVVTTGAFTIPLMKKVGYSGEFAASVEAIASTGGQIMPPVMGSAAFIMAEFLGMGYRDIMVAAIIPAVLYYLALWINVDLRAKKLGLRGLSDEEIPSAKEDFQKYGHLLLSIAFLLYLIFANFTPYYAAFYSIIALVVLAMVRKSSRLTGRQILDCLATGARGAVSIAVATAVVGIVVGMINLTGLGLQLSGMIIRLTGSRLLPTLILTMVACLILGMGLPTSAAYIVSGTVVAPVLLKLGVDPLLAHFYVFYFSIISVVTPPVAVASYAAAGMAEENPTRVGWQAMALGLVAFIVPYMFVGAPGLLMQGVWYTILLNFATAVIGVFMLASGIQGYWKTNMSWLARFLCIVGSVLFLDGGIVTDLCGMVIAVIVFLIQSALAKKQKLEDANNT